MRRNATPSSGGSGSGRGSRLRFTLLLATVAAFLLVPVAQAAANATAKVNIAGTGSGEVSSEAGFGYQGTPTIECSYASPGPATGVCENEVAKTEGGEEVVNLIARPAPGSEFAGWTIQEGANLTGCSSEAEGWFFVGKLPMKNQGDTFAS